MPKLTVSFDMDELNSDLYWRALTAAEVSHEQWLNMPAEVIREMLEIGLKKLCLQRLS